MVVPLAFLLCLLFPVALAAMGLLNLPPGPVSVTHGPWDQGTLGGTIDITLSGVPAGYDVMDGTYAGWCAEDNFQDDQNGSLTLIDSTDDTANLPPSYQSVPWDKVNYLLNHKAGTAQQVQVALWLLTWGTSSTFPADAAALAMYDDAMANGAGFVPAPGQVVAVLLHGDGLGPEGFQDTLIEVPLPPPPPDGEGCTPGGWQGGNLAWRWDQMPDPDFDPANGNPFYHETDFNGFFVSEGSLDGLTMFDLVSTGGKKDHARKAARSLVAAYLNASHAGVDYPKTTDELKDMWADAVANGTFLDLHNELDGYNNLGCEIE
jgi:hypothetical protein